MPVIVNKDVVMPEQMAKTIAELLHVAEHLASDLKSFKMQLIFTNTDVALSDKEKELIAEFTAKAEQIVKSYFMVRAEMIERLMMRLRLMRPHDQEVKIFGSQKLGDS